MTITLEATKTLAGIAGTATAVTYTVFGDEYLSGTNTFKQIAQGQLPNTATVLYTATGVAAIITSVKLANTTGSPVTGVKLFTGGTAATNQITGSFTIPANGSATVTSEHLEVQDSTGALVATSSITLTGDITGTGVGSVATTLATVNGNVGSFGDSSHVAAVTVNAKGLTTAASQVLITPAAIGAPSGSGTHSGTSSGTNTGDQTATTTPSNATGTVAATNVQAAIAELDTEKVPTTRLVSTTAPITGGGDLSVDRTIALTTSPVGQTPVGVTRTITTTAPLTIDGGASANLSADRTLAITAASTSAAGSMSAIDKTTVNNLWYDVTNYGVSTGNSGAANVAAMNTLIQTTAPATATFYFPPTGANYPMTGTITITKSHQTFRGSGAMRASVIFCANTTTDLFSITDAVTNITFQDLGFWSTATATAGSMIACGTVSGTGNQQVNFYRLGMEGFGGNWFNGITFNGTRGGEVCNIEDCVFNAFTGWGVGMVGNTTIPNTTSAVTVTNTLMNGNINGTSGATAGIYCQQVGALQINNSDIIQCTNSILAAPITSVNQVVASIYAVNSYFDSSYGSCVKLGGTQPIVRCKFVSCSFTVSNQAAAPNANAFEISNSAANPPGDIDLLNCNFQNTFNNTNVSNGILISTGMNIKIVGCNISGFTTGIQVTPSAAGVTRLHILGNTIGPGTITHTATTTGILLNAGAAAYGLVQMQDNVFPQGNAFQVANTTNITDNSTLGATTAATGQKVVSGNSGLVVARPANYTATTIPLTTVTGVDSRGGIYFPPGVRPCSGRITVYATNAATAQTLTVTMRYGINNSNADTAIYTQAHTAGTAAVGSGIFVFDWDLLTATTMGMSARFVNGNNAATGITGTLTPFQLQTSLATPATIATNVNNWLGIYFSSATASAITIRSVKEEILSQ